MTPCKEGKLSPREESQLLGLVNIIIKCLKPDFISLCLCVSLYLLQQDIPACKCSFIFLAGQIAQVLGYKR